jgi:hypothetical protein
MVEIVLGSRIHAVFASRIWQESLPDICMLGLHVNGLTVSIYVEF